MKYPDLQREVMSQPPPHGVLLGMGGTIPNYLTLKCPDLNRKEDDCKLPSPWE